MTISKRLDLHDKIDHLFAHQERLGATDFENLYIHLLLCDLFEIFCDFHHNNDVQVGSLRRFVQIELAHYAEHAAMWRSHGITARDLQLALRQLNYMLYRVRYCPTVSEVSESCHYVGVTYTLHNPRYLWLDIGTYDYVIVPYKN